MTTSDPAIASTAQLRNRIANLPGTRVLVLSGGGGNGAAEAGAVLELMRAGYVPDMIVGTSIGAWNAAYLAANPGPAGAASLVEQWRSGTFAQMAIPGPGSLARFATGRSASPLGSGMVARVARATGLAETRWSSLSTPLVVGAVDVATGELRYWDSRTVADGPVLTQVSASSGLAPMQPLATVDGVQYADAGFKDNYGIRAAVRAAGTSSSLMVLDAAPLPGPAPVTRGGAAAVLAESLIFSGARDEHIADAREAGVHVDLLAVGGRHGVTSYWDPSAGIDAGAAAVGAWGVGLTPRPLWRRVPLHSRVIAAVSAVTRAVSLSRAGAAELGE